MNRRILPLLGMAASVPLFALAAEHYPGGSDWDPNTLGFDISQNYVCALFQPLAINGQSNTARPYAIPGILLLCTSMGYMFWAVARACTERVTRKAIEIFGIGTMVYTFLGINTPLHDLLVLIAAMFYTVAALGMLRMLHSAQRIKGVVAGLLCLALLAALVAARHGALPLEWAPLTEWLLFVAAATWLAGVYATVIPAETGKAP